MQDLLNVILPVFLVIGYGYLAAWKGWFSPAGVDGLMVFTQKFAIPVLLFRAISRLDLGQNFDLALLLSFYGGGSSPSIRPSATGSALKVLKAMLANALILGIIAGFVVNLGGVPVPEVVASAVDLISRAALPAALFGLGGVLLRYRPEGDLRTILFIVSVSLFLHPAITWGLGQAFDLPRPAFRSAVLTAAMAPGINAYVFANIYGVAKRVAASAVLIGTAATILTAWLWLLVLP